MSRRTLLLSGGAVAALATVTTAWGGGILRGRDDPAGPVGGTSPSAGPRDGKSPALGINLTPISYYTPVVFLDRVKASGQWDTFGKPAPVDELGYPTSLGGQRFVAAMLPCEAGRYVLRHDGDLDARLQGAAIVSRSKGRIVFAVKDATTHRTLILDAIRKPPRTLSLVREEQAAAFDAGEIFAPEFLAQVRGFDTLRFMDWMRTNGSKVTDRYTPVGACSWAGGVPIEIMAALARKIGAHPWICIPHLATDELATTMIADLRRAMGDGKAPYIEYSNEVWNLGFAQTRHAAERATALWGAGATPGNYYGYRAGQIAKLARNGGCRMVIGCQTATPERAEQIWDGVKRAGAGDADFAGWIVAAYVAGTLTLAQGPTLDLAARKDVAGAIGNILSSTDPGSMSVAAMARTYARHGEIAREHRLEMIAYEGNLHLNALPVFAAQLPAVKSFFEDVTKSPAAARVMEANLDAFGAAGGRLACLFNLSSAPGGFGAFGLVDSGAWPAVRRRIDAR